MTTSDPTTNPVTDSTFPEDTTLQDLLNQAQQVADDKFPLDDSSQEGDSPFNQGLTE